MNIETLIKEGANITLSLSLKDLEAFADMVCTRTVSNAKEMFSSSERLYDKETVMDLLGISATTLWRMQKRGILNHIEVNGLRRWRKSDIDKLMKG